MKNQAEKIRELRQTQQDQEEINNLRRQNDTLSEKVAKLSQENTKLKIQLMDLEFRILNLGS